MTPQKRFAEKNARRRAGASDTRGKPPAIREARRPRRLCRGAFGGFTANQWNERVLGTTGEWK